MVYGDASAATVLGLTMVEQEGAAGAVIAVAAASVGGAEEGLEVAALERFRAVSHAALVAAVAVGTGAVIEAGAGAASGRVSGARHWELWRRVGANRV